MTGARRLRRARARTVAAARRAVDAGFARSAVFELDDDEPLDVPHAWRDPVRDFRAPLRGSGAARPLRHAESRRRRRARCVTVRVMGDVDDTALREYYDQDAERARLDGPAGMLEFERTKEILLRHLPAAPSDVADIGGGPGRYTFWLAERGHRVEHRDLMPRHVQRVLADGADLPLVHSGVSDARDLDLDDASVDAVLLLGPLYHLRHREDRLLALAEARRVVRPGGAVFVAAISRWAPRLQGELALRLYERFPATRDLSRAVEHTGWMPPLYPGAFAAYCHRPWQLRAELLDGGLRVVDLVSVEGMAAMLPDLAERIADPLGHTVVLDTARAHERVPELLGIGPHLVATAVRPVN